jgi:ferredoxin-NADP reductase
MIAFLLISILLISATLILLIMSLWHLLSAKSKKKSLTLKVKSKKFISSDLCELKLSRSIKFRSLPKFKPGQYLTLVTTINNQEIKRFYSISNWSKWPFYYKLVIKKESQGKCSSYVYDKIQVGDSLNLISPKGDFYFKNSLQQNETENIVLIAGGVGVTPIRSMWEYLLKYKTKNQNVFCFYSTKLKEELCFLEEFMSESKKDGYFFLPFISRGVNPIGFNSGRISATVISNFVKIEDISQVYICASSVMMKELEQGLINDGLQKTRIQYELFGFQQPSSNNSCKITCEGHNELTYNGEGTLLCFLEKNGYPIDSICKSGTCGCCKLKVNSGNVKYLINPDCNLCEDEILPCCCVPDSDLELSAENLVN